MKLHIDFDLAVRRYECGAVLKVVTPFESPLAPRLGTMVTDQSLAEVMLCNLHRTEDRIADFDIPTEF